MCEVIAISGWKGSGKDTMGEHLNLNHGATLYSFAGALKDSVSQDYGIPRADLDDPSKKEAPLLGLPATTSLFMLRNLDVFRDGAGRKIKIFTTESRVVLVVFFISVLLVLYHQKTFLECYFITIFLVKPVLELVDLRVTTLFWTPRALCIYEGHNKRAVNKDIWIDKVLGRIRIDKPKLAVITDLRFTSEANKLRERYKCKLIRINRHDHSPSSDPSERDLDKYPGFDYVLENRHSIQEFHDNIENLISQIFPEEDGS